MNIVKRIMRRGAALAVFIGCLLLAAKPWGRCMAQDVLKHELLITELYPDPDARSPIPVSEFVELKNMSSRTINLRGLKLTDGTGTATISIDFDLKADSFVILSAQAAALNFRSYGPTIGLSSFPSLNNDRDNISLLNGNGSIIHAISYTTAWYRNDAKKNGGYTLEIIDPSNACGGALNWRASEDASGGTPGRTNSVNASNPDEMPPALLRVIMKDSLSMLVVFDEPIDSLSGTFTGSYKFDDAILKLAAAIPVSPDFREILLLLERPVPQDKIYRLTISKVTDCSGNEIGALNTALCGRPGDPSAGDIIINELLFNPASGGYDYIELYNKGKSAIDAGRLMIAGRNSTGGFIDLVAVGAAGRLFFPGDYLLVTENIDWVSQNYSARNMPAMQEVGDLPSMPDDKGNVVLLDMNGKVIDEVVYSEKWHFALLNNKEGIALERIDYSQPPDVTGNWTSAASAAGFGTPGYQNSQFRADLQVGGDFAILPVLFSPDNDGVNDVAGISYQMAEAGYMGSINIYDAAGRPVRYLLKSGLLGIKGTINWDGLDEKRQKLPVGSYVVMIEVFNLKGKVKRMKKVVVLAR